MRHDRSLAQSLRFSTGAVEKHVRHDHSLAQSLRYTLLYPDGSEVINMPGSDCKPFVLMKYKEEVGKSYARITLNLCTVADHCLAEMPRGGDTSPTNTDDDGSYTDDHEDDGDDILLKPAFLSKKVSYLKVHLLQKQLLLMIRLVLLPLRHHSSKAQS